MIVNHVHKILLALIALILMGSLLTACGSDDDGDEADIETAPVVTDNSEEGISIVSSEVSADFPKSLTFDLEAKSGSPINSVELRYRIEKITERSVTATIKPEFDPGRNVEVVWVWDTRKTSLPPGAQIEYRWIIKDESGGTLESDVLEFAFSDTRYDWEELTEGNVNLFWYEGEAEFARALMDAAQGALEKLEVSTGGVLEEPVKLFIYANSTELRQALVFPQEWTGGIAFTEYGIVAIGISESNLDWGKRTVAHELSHLVIEQVTASPYNTTLPTWLDEGLAMYAEGDLRYDLADDLSAAIESDTLFSVASLSGSFPADPAEAGLAYAQSYSLVNFLIENYGSARMLQFLEMFKEGSTPDDALLAVYGFDSAQLDELWRSDFGLIGQASGLLLEAVC